MKIPFNEVSYLAQVRRLRNMAAAAIAQYPIQIKTINFIHHGENTTFRIDAKNGRRKRTLRSRQSCIESIGLQPG